MGINLEKVRFKQRQNQRDDAINILKGGRLVEKMGVEYAIQAVAGIIHNHSTLDARYRIAGEVPLRTKLEVLTSGLPGEPLIHRRR